MVMSTKRYCDICGKEGAENNIIITHPRGVVREIIKIPIFYDLCDECKESVKNHLNSLKRGSLDQELESMGKLKQ